MKKISVLIASICLASQSFAVNKTYESSIMTAMRIQMSIACDAAAKVYSDEKTYYENHNHTLPASHSLKNTFNDRSPVETITNRSETGAIVLTYKARNNTEFASVNPLLDSQQLVLIPSKKTDGKLVFYPASCYTTTTLNSIYPNFTSAVKPQIIGTNCGPCQYLSNLNHLTNPTVS